VEELQDGIAYCQIFDAIYPGKVPLRKLNFDASNPKEFEQNLKVRASTYSAFALLVLTFSFPNLSSTLTGLGRGFDLCCCCFGAAADAADAALASSCGFASPDFGRRIPEAEHAVQGGHCPRRQAGTGPFRRQLRVPAMVPRTHLQASP
jgi:hypothetical protein